MESSIEDVGLIKEGEPDFFLLVDPSSLTIPFDHDQAVFKIWFDHFETVTLDKKVRKMFFYS